MASHKGKPSPHRGKGKLLAWLKAHVDHDGEECLIWPFSKTYQGYGQLGFHGKVRKAHRVMCELVNGPPPTPEHEAAHQCGKGHLGCVHPKHVEWKTPAGNRADMIQHGTWQKKVARRLTLDMVEQIRASEISCVDLAAQYNVSVSAIFKIKRGETWTKPRSRLTLKSIRSIKDATESEAIDLGKSLGIDKYKVQKLRAGQIFSGIE